MPPPRHTPPPSRLPTVIEELSSLIPGHLDSWMTQNNISLPVLLSAFKSKSAEIEQAVRLDRETLIHVPRAIGDYICPLLPAPPRLSVAAKTALVNLFKSAQILKAEAVAKAKAEAATKVAVDPKLEAEA